MAKFIFMKKVFYVSKTSLASGEQKQRQGGKAPEQKKCWLALNFNKAPPEPRRQASVGVFLQLCGGLERAAPRIMCVKLLSERTSDQLSFIVIEKISFSFLGLRENNSGFFVLINFNPWLTRMFFWKAKRDVRESEFFHEHECFPHWMLEFSEWKKAKSKNESIKQAKAWRMRATMRNPFAERGAIKFQLLSSTIILLSASIYDW